MIDLYLRTETEQALKDACPFLLDEEGNWHHDTRQFSLSIIGPVTTTEGEYDEEGEVITPPVMDERFHANLRVVDESILDLVPEDVRLEPTSPVRGWA